MEHVDELVLLLPGYELEGYPRELDSDSAARLLSGWVGLWHPGLLYGVGKIPRWHQASRLPSQLNAVLFVLPPASAASCEVGASDRIKAAGGLLLEPSAGWREFQESILELVPDIPNGEIVQEMAEEFASLGYGYLQIQLMTRQLRYTSNLDVALFEEQVMRACESAVHGDRQTAGQRLQACFDTLGQERDHYYSNDAHLIDLTLVADTTLGDSLKRQLNDPQRTNLLISAELLERIKQRSEPNWNRLRERLLENKLCLIGGLERESPLPLAPRESNIRAFQRAPDAYRRLSIEPPRVFSRLSYGMHADLPAVLTRFGYSGAVLIAFTGGRYPTGSQPKISWEAQDGCRLPTIATQALDAASPSSFLALGWAVGEALDRQQVPTLVLAHWPGGSCEFYGLLKILASRTPALGNWSLLDDYFDNTDAPFHHQKLDSDAFFFDWLAESQSPGELLLTVKLAHKLQARARCLQNLANLVWQLKNSKISSKVPQSESKEPLPPDVGCPQVSLWDPNLDQFLCQLDFLIEQMEQPVERYRELQSFATRLCQGYMQQLQQLLVGERGKSSGRLLFNPRSCPVRATTLTTSEKGLDSQADWHFASGLAGENRITRVDLPSLGFVASPILNCSSKATEKNVLADAAGMLQNEFIECQIDRSRGSLKSLHIPAVRGNRLSVQVAYREREGSKFRHSEMVAKQVSLLTCSNMVGIIRSSGFLQWGGKAIAAFEIDYEIQRGSRWISLKITLSDLRFPNNTTPGKESNPWRSAFVLRWAWPTEAAILRTFPDSRRSAWTSQKTVAADLIEIDEASYKTYFLTGGLAFHCREEMRFAETILATSGQSTVRHRIGLAVDLPYPVLTAQQFMDKPYEIDIDALSTSANGWLVNVDSKNVIVDCEGPLLDANEKTVGLRVLVSEIEGKSTTTRIRWFRDVGQANRVNFLGNKMTRLVSKGDEVTIALRAHEQAVVDLIWAS